MGSGFQSLPVLFVSSCWTTASGFALCLQQTLVPLGCSVGFSLPLESPLWFHLCCFSYYSIIRAALISSVILSMSDHHSQIFLVSQGPRPTFPLHSTSHSLVFSWLSGGLFVFSSRLFFFFFNRVLFFDIWSHLNVSVISWLGTMHSWYVAGLCLYTRERLGVSFLESVLGRGQASLPGPPMMGRGLSPAHR